MNRRISWIDVARALGIFAIYVGHIPNSDTGSTAFPFVWTFHVPLFFFISGCTETINKETRFFHYVLKKVKGILIPWLMFSLLALALYVIKKQCTIQELQYYLRVIKNGNIRNSFLAGSLWFLTCLFVVQIACHVIIKLKNKWLILAVSIAICVCSEILFGQTMPAKPFNYDSAMFFQIYYILGYLLFPYINRILNARSIGGKILLALSGIVVTRYAIQRYFGSDIFGQFYSVQYIGVLMEVIATLLLIWLVVILAKILENVAILQNIGSNTMYLCGSEYLITALVTNAVDLLGITVTVHNALAAAIYACVLLLLANQFLVPAEKKMLGSVLKIPDYFLRSDKGQSIQM